ncbi:hypothetical protein RRG08_018143 [Elysia crispata]|uniref:Uncharacterized protein n=1 Tax=Elysia crispata TaxID=231223 RepID=A0AAE1E6W1_9GAST|nr:hypothetical protein RRG08_018143 [Elysia crispata]
MKENIESALPNVSLSLPVFKPARDNNVFHRLSDYGAGRVQPHPNMSGEAKSSTNELPFAVCIRERQGVTVPLPSPKLHHIAAFGFHNHLLLQTYSLNKRVLDIVAVEGTESSYSPAQISRDFPVSWRGMSSRTWNLSTCGQVKRNGQS